MHEHYYRVPLAVAATASATFYVSADSPREALAAARDRLIHNGRALLALDCPGEAALHHADLPAGQAVEEISSVAFDGEPTPENADCDSELTPLERERYLVADSSSCPFCETWDIDGGPMDIESGSAYQDITCNRCGGTWVDRYRLATEGPYHVHRPDRAAIVAAGLDDVANG